MQALTIATTTHCTFLVPDGVTDPFTYMARLSAEDIASASVKQEGQPILRGFSERWEFPVWVEFTAALAAQWGWTLQDGDESWSQMNPEWVVLRPVIHEPSVVPMPPATFSPFNRFRRKVPANQVPANPTLAYLA